MASRSGHITPEEKKVFLNPKRSCIW